jgi:peptidoglycan LD-endopeptidase LytH
MSARLRVLLIIVVVFTGLAAFLWLRSQSTGLINDTIYFGKDGKATGSVSANPSPLYWTPMPSPDPSPQTSTSSPPPVSSDALNTATPAPEITPPPKEILLPGNYVGTLKLIIPVVGVRPDQLLDTFTDARSEGRAHDAIDIPAPAGTPVVAAADGEIIKLFQSERGGTTIYQLSTDKKLVFYYAHLQRYADGLTVGKFARQGEMIAYVGDTGNAGTGNYHLHFSISVVADPKRYWEGTNINPYPLLRR